VILDFAKFAKRENDRAGSSRDCRKRSGKNKFSPSLASPCLVAATPTACQPMTAPD
jgi:hypothetical protein